MKNVSKNKFLTCFRPAVDFDTMLESESVIDPSINRRKHERQNSTTNSMFLDQNCSKSIQDQVVGHPPKQTLAKVIKAVVFQTILNTIHKKNRYNQSCFGSKRSYSLHTRRSSFKTNKEEIKEIESSLSSSSSSCSPVSELKNLSKSNESELGKQKEFQWLGIYMMVLICLVVTIFCGKINVFILTSMFFSCFSLWNASSHLLKRVCKLSNTKSKAQKNRHCGL